MRGQGYDANGHRRVYYVTLKDPSYTETKRDMLWVDEDNISVIHLLGLVTISRDDLALLLWSNRHREGLTIELKFVHLYCTCPKRVTTSRDPAYQETLFTYKGWKNDGPTVL